MNRKELIDDFMKARILSEMKSRSTRLLNTIPELAGKNDGFVYLNAMSYESVADSILKSLDEYLSLFAGDVAEYYEQLKEKSSTIREEEELPKICPITKRVLDF